PLHILADGGLGEVLLRSLLMIDFDFDDGLDRLDVAGHRLRAGDAIESVRDLRRRVLEFLRVRRRERDVDRLRTGRRTPAEQLDVTDALEVVELPLQIRGDSLRRAAGRRVEESGTW